jgi:hypothetical protein
MEFNELRDDVLERMPTMGRKARRHVVAVVNNSHLAWPFLNRPDLLARYLRLLDIRASRLVRRYSPHDPNRIPK